MRSLIYISLIITIVSCTFRKTKDCAVGTLDNKIILQSEIDSIIAFDVYNLRIKTIRNIIDSEIIKMESKKLNISVDSFLRLNIYPNSIDEYKVWLKENGSTNGNKSKYTKKTFNQNETLKSDSIFNQLRKKHKIEILLPPPTFKYQAFKNLYSYNWNVRNARETIIVLFNYDCPICSINDKEIKAISKYFNLNLKYIYYTDYVTNYALLCDAALKQNRYWEMHDRVISSGCTDNLKPLMFFADSLGMDTIRLTNDLKDKKILKQHLMNSDIIQSMNIYSVPTYIYQNSIFHDIETLEMVIQEE